jgi:Co/Zn/Cd efflux system component
MIDKMKDIILLAQDATFGWRKLGVLIGMLSCLFAWLFLRIGVVQDLPLVFAATIVTLFGIFAVANWGEHQAKGKADGD